GLVLGPFAPKTETQPKSYSHSRDASDRNARTPNFLAARQRSPGWPFAAQQRFPAHQGGGGRPPGAFRRRLRVAPRAGGQTFVRLPPIRFLSFDQQWHFDDAPAFRAGRLLPLKLDRHLDGLITLRAIEIDCLGLYHLSGFFFTQRGHGQLFNVRGTSG